MLKVFLVGMMVTLTAGFGVVAWVSLRPAPAPAPVAVADAPLPPPPAKIVVLAVSRAVRAGELLRPEDIGTVELAAAGAPEGTQADSPAARAELAGAMTRRAMTALQPVLPGDVLRPTDGGFLAAVLSPRHRAVSIAVDAVSGTAGLIWPGDRVDIILTQTLDEAGTPVGRRIFGETVLSDIRVIAVDQQLARGVSPDAGAGASSMGGRTVTMEVLPDAAEKVAVAVRLGKVALAVRALNVSEAVEYPRSSAATVGEPAGQDVVTPRQVIGTPLLRTISQVAPTAALPAPAGSAKAAAITWGQDVSPALNRRASAPATSNTVRVFQGAGGEKEFKFE